jgi:hypothetical protein
MGRLQRLLTAVIVVAICFAADGASASADEDSVLRILAAGQQAMLERHYRQAVHVLRDGLKEHPGDNRCGWNSDARTCPLEPTVEQFGFFVRFSGLSRTIG